MKSDGDRGCLSSQVVSHFREQQKAGWFTYLDRAFQQGITERRGELNEGDSLIGTFWFNVKYVMRHPSFLTQYRKSDSYVYDRLRVLDRLHPTIQRELVTHVCKSPITSSHAERLTLIEDMKLQLKLAELVRKKHLSVRQLERLTRRIRSQMPNGCICKQCPNYPCKHIPEQDNLLTSLLKKSFHQKQQMPTTPSLKWQNS